MKTTRRRRIPIYIGASCLSAALSFSSGATIATAAHQVPAIAVQDDSGSDQSGTDTGGQTDTTHPQGTDTNDSGTSTDTTHPQGTDTNDSGTSTDTTHPQGTDTNDSGTSTDTTHPQGTDTNDSGTSTDTTHPQGTDTNDSGTSTDTTHRVKTRQDTNMSNKLKPDLTPSTTDTPSAKPKVPPKPLKPLTSVERQKIACALGGISKIGRALKIIKDGKVVQTLEYIKLTGKGLVIGKEAATGALYEMAWDAAELITWPPGTGQVISCIRVFDRMSQEDAAKFEAGIIKFSDLENTLKKNKVKSVKIQQAPGVKQNQLPNR
ncbi:hypothetical protein OG311_37945 (plasmid) [Streptomyces sp. NBC_01343]|uniref:hypothetical protein n=1 Tax=Streptomyces sp. NBC_01343 TaxID=2903832 RepID=UPI002E166ADE|nr:hypothetical protein OG311_37945 [Streptomyces sp. NBC_01343]